MSFLMRKLLERQGILSDAVAGEGEAGGSGTGDAGTGAGDGAGQANGAGAGAGDGAGEGAKAGEDDAAAAAAAAAAAQQGKPGNTGISDKEAQLLKDTMKWKDKAKALETDLSAIKTVLGDLKPEDVQKLANDAKERARTELEKKGEYDRIIEQMRSENQKVFGQKDEVITGLQTELQKAQKQIEDLTIGQGFRGSEFIRERSTLPPSIAQREFADYFEFKDGQLVPYDKPRNASDRTPLVDGNGNFKPFDQAIEELFSKHPDAKSLIKASMKPGAGSRSQPDVKAGNGQQKTQVRGLAKIESGLNNLGKTNQ